MDEEYFFLIFHFELNVWGDGALKQSQNEETASKSKLLATVALCRELSSYFKNNGNFLLRHLNVVFFSICVLAK